MTNVDHLEDVAAYGTVSRALQQALRSWDGFFEWLPIGVYVCDADGNILLHNRRAAELWGRAPLPGESESAFWLSSRAYAVGGSFGSQGTAVTGGPVSDLLMTGRPVHDREFMIERPDGRRITLLANLDPLFDDNGNVIGGVNCFQDITRRKRVETVRRERERQFRDLLEALPVAVYTTDALGNLTFYNAAAAKMWGREPKLGSARWCGSWRLFRPDGRDMAHEDGPMATAIKAEREIGDVEAQLERPDGIKIPFISYPTLLRDKAGALIGAVNMMVDISERKRTELEQKTLMDELNHRVKNTLATVQSIAAQTFRKAQVPPELRELFERRIFALSKAHNQLSSSRWTSADLQSLAREILDPFQDDEAAPRVLVEGEGVDLAPHAALTFALALNELATNAAKYGALSTPAGRVSLRWSVQGEGADRELALEWRETGGPPVVRPKESGFGTRFVERGLAQQLKGRVTLDFDPAGLRCRMTIPLKGNGV